MSWAADAAGHPDPWALKNSDCLFVGQYVGTDFQHYGVDRGYIDNCLSIGLGVFLIFEEWSSQFLGGYDVAVQMMVRMRQGWDRLGAPNDGSVIPAVALVDPDPSRVYGNEDSLRWFTRGVNDACWLPEFTGYGSRYGLDIVEDVAPKMTRRWGVGPWGFGESGNGNLPPNVPADMIQHGNRAAPVRGCDYNTLFREDMGQWGGPTPTKPEEPKEEDVMYIAVGDALMGRVAATVDGGYRVGEIFAGPTGPYGIPQSAIDWNSQGGRGLKYVYLDNDRFAKVLEERPNPNGGGGSNPDKPITAFPDPEFIDEYKRRVAKGDITPEVVDT